MKPKRKTDRVITRPGRPLMVTVLTNNLKVLKTFGQQIVLVVIFNYIYLNINLFDKFCFHCS